MHNYQMAVTEREVINGCLSITKDVKGYRIFHLVKQGCRQHGFYRTQQFSEMVPQTNQFLETLLSNKYLRVDFGLCVTA